MNDRPITVLVVDDDEGTRELIDLILAQEPGVYYAIAAGGANALAKLGENPPDVLLTDMLMPKVSGAQVVKTARGRYPGIPIITYSAQPADADVDRAHLVDGEQVIHLRKPFDITLLIALIRELAAQSAWRLTGAPA